MFQVCCYRISLFLFLLAALSGRGELGKEGGRGGGMAYINKLEIGKIATPTQTSEWFPDP